MPLVRHTKHHLKVFLNDDEIRIKGENLAFLEEELTNLQSNLKAQTTVLKEGIAHKQAEVVSSVRVIRDRAEYREVDCEEQFNEPDKGMKRIVRLDTGEVVRVTQMDNDERQMSLPIEQGGLGEGEDEPPADKSVQ